MGRFVLNVLMGLANPMTWLIVAMFVSWWRMRKSKTHHRQSSGRDRQRVIPSDAGIAAAFQLLSLAYRPNHAFVAKAQIQQQEDVDEDDDGSPETPIKHLHRQLRRIRRGEPVDHLVWRLE
jgi:hypothetical protein